MKSKRSHRSSGKEKGSRLGFTSSTKREIRKFHVVVMQRRQRNVKKKKSARGRAGSVPEISVSQLEILPYEYFSLVTGVKTGWIVAVRMASSCIACCIFHIISIPFNCSDTALRVTDAKIGPKVKIFVFRHVCFVSRIWRQNSSPGSLTFYHLGNRAEISHINQSPNSCR